jgi:hypothetical protein
MRFVLQENPNAIVCNQKGARIGSRSFYAKWPVNDVNTMCWTPIDPQTLLPFEVAHKVFYVTRSATSLIGAGSNIEHEAIDATEEGTEDGIDDGSIDDGSCAFLDVTDRDLDDLLMLDDDMLLPPLNDMVPPDMSILMALDSDTRAFTEDAMLADIQEPPPLLPPPLGATLVPSFVFPPAASPIASPVAFPAATLSPIPPPAIIPPPLAASPSADMVMMHLVAAAAAAIPQGSDFTVHWKNGQGKTLNISIN